MRTRDSKRLSKWLYDTGKTSEDKFKIVQSSYGDLRFSVRHRKYFLFVHGLCRAHCCHFKLTKILYEEISGSMATFQRQTVAPQIRKHNDLIQAIEGKLSPDHKIIGCHSYGTMAKLIPCGQNKKIARIVHDVFEENLEPQQFEAIKTGYQNSSRVVENSRLVGAFTRLAEERNKPMDRAVVKKILFMRLAMEKHNGLVERPEVKVTVEELSKVKNGGSAAGILPVRPVKGVATRVTGQKFDMHAAAVSVNLRDSMIDKPPSQLPFKPFLKEEVIKSDKDVRGIQNESLANYQILRQTKAQKIRTKVGEAVGMGSQINGYANMFYMWYFIYHQETGGLWSEFLAYLNEVGAHESDKKGWETRTGPNDGMPELIYELLCVKIGENARKPYLRALSDYLNPFIYIDKCGFYAPWRVASGTVYTSEKNTKRHTNMNLYMCTFITEHGNRLGKQGCKCDVCENVPGVGLEVSRLSLALRRRAFKLGDDYIAVSMGKEQDEMFDTIMDYVFGTMTVSEHKHFFREPHAEFLRRSFILYDDRVVTFRQTERALAKVYHGSFLLNASRLAAGLVSLKYEAGWNEKLVDIISKIMTKIHCEVDKAEYTKSLQKYHRRNPAIGDVVHYLTFSMQDVINQQLQVIDPLFTLAEDYYTHLE